MLEILSNVFPDCSASLDTNLKSTSNELIVCVTKQRECDKEMIDRGCWEASTVVRFRL